MKPDITSGQPRLFERFTELSCLYPAARRGGRGNHSISRSDYTMAQHEMFHIAQALGAQYFPDLQYELYTVRCKIVSHLIQHARQARLKVDSGHIRPVVVHRLRWDDIQITPEIANDPALTGRAVPRELVQAIKRLHAQQISALRDLFRRWEKKS